MSRSAGMMLARRSAKGLVPLIRSNGGGSVGVGTTTTTTSSSSSGATAAAVRTMASMPVPQSQNAKLFEGHQTDEGWESTIAWWYGTSLVLIVIALGFTPHTEITAWANKEASARLKLKASGVQDFVFGMHYQDLSVAEAKDAWDMFSTKALRMNDDDDDDDDDEEEEDEEDEDGDE